MPQRKDIRCMIMNNIENENQIEDMQDVMTENFLPETAVLEDEVERFIEPDAEDILWFSLKKGDMHFKIGLSDILMCLKFAEEQGEVPKLPLMWWTRISSMYPKLDAFQKD